MGNGIQCVGHGRRASVLGSMNTGGSPGTNTATTHRPAHQASISPFGNSDPTERHVLGGIVHHIVAAV